MCTKFTARFGRTRQTAWPSGARQHTLVVWVAVLHIDSFTASPTPGCPPISLPQQKTLNPAAVQSVLPALLASCSRRILIDAKPRWPRTRRCSLAHTLGSLCSRSPDVVTRIEWLRCVARAAMCCFLSKLTSTPAFSPSFPFGICFLLSRCLFSGIVCQSGACLFHV